MQLIRQATPADASGIARVHVDTWQATYAGLLPAEYLAQLSWEKRTQQWTRGLEQPELDCFTYVAVLDGQIVGFAAGGPEREGHTFYTGELYAIYILPTAQRQGLGHQLFQAVVQNLMEQGHGAMLVWVVKQNPACSFYAALGGERQLERTVLLGSTPLAEVGYGWEINHSAAGKP